MTDDTRDAIRKAFLSGQLQVESVDASTGKVFKATVNDICKHHTPNKSIMQVTLVGDQSVCCTVDHSLFGPSIQPLQVGDMIPGDPVVIVENGEVRYNALSECKALPPEEYTYDLSVPGPENFVLTNGILAHNSYSIGGVSLEIEKSSKYQSMMDTANTQFEKATEAKSRTVKFMRGLQQPRFGIGCRSSFGPYTARGVLSPRSFI